MSSRRSRRLAASTSRTWGIGVALAAACASPAAAGLGETCRAADECESPLECVRGICFLPEPPLLDAGSTRDAPAVADSGPMIDVPAAVDAPMDAGLVPDRPPPTGDATGPYLPRPPERTHSGAPGPYAIVLDWERHRVFASLGRSGAVEVIDLSTGERGLVTTGHFAERMSFDAFRDEIVIALPVGYHDSFWFDLNWGFVSTIDPATFAVREPVRVAVDPWDVAPDGTGRVYVSGGSGQWTEIVAVDLVTGANHVGSDVYMGEELAVHPSRARLYGARTTWLSPGAVNRYDLVDTFPLMAGEYARTADLGGVLRVDPTGDLLVTSGGSVFALSEAADSDVVLTGTTPAWTDAAFHPAGHRLFAAHEGVGLVVYEIPALTPLATIAVDRPIRRIFAARDYLLLVHVVVGGAPETLYEVRWYESL